MKKGSTIELFIDQNSFFIDENSLFVDANRHFCRSRQPFHHDACAFLVGAC